MRPALASVSVAPPGRPPGPHKHREVMPDAFTVGEISTQVVWRPPSAHRVAPSFTADSSEMRAVRHGRDDAADSDEAESSDGRRTPDPSEAEHLVRGKASTPTGAP